MVDGWMDGRVGSRQMDEEERKERKQEPQARTLIFIPFPHDATSLVPSKRGHIPSNLRN